jgi:hypothetical protein
MILSLACVECWECWSSICRDVRWPWWDLMLWFDQSLERWRRLQPSQFAVSHARICWGPSLRSRHPRTTGAAMCRYGTACLLIRDVVGSVPCSDEWEIGVVTHLVSHAARGDVVLCTTPLNLSIDMVPRTTLAKSGIRPIVNLCNDM